MTQGISLLVGHASGYQQKEAVLAGAFKPNDVKDRVMQCRQAAVSQERDQTSYDGRQYSDLKGDEHEDGPAVQRSATDVERVIDDRAVPLQSIGERRHDQAGDQHDQPNLRGLHLKNVVESRDGERGKSCLLYTSDAADDL